MPPKFPVAKRIELENPPLDLVVCQLRFPTVLALVGDRPPIGFQDKISSRYPVARRRTSRKVEVDGLIPVARFSDSAIWCFEDRNSRYTVSIGPDFVTLETKRYQRFSEFIEKFWEIVETATEVYPAIQLRERLGLRYIDRLNRTAHPTLPSDWPNRLQSDIIPLREMREESEPQLGNLESRFSFGDRFLTVRSSFVDAGFPGVEEAELTLDFDCYTEVRGDLNDTRTCLKEFHQIAYDAFRWAVGDLIESFPVATEGASL